MATSPSDNWNRARQLFADQFEKYGNDFVYRRSQKGEAIRVSAQERSDFIEQHERNARRARWILYAGMAAGFGGFIYASVSQGRPVPEPAMIGGIGFIVVAYFAFYLWAWGAPARALAGRTPVARERSADEVRRIRLNRISYGQLAVAALAGITLPFGASARHDPFSGWNRLWLAFGAGIIVLVAVQTFRKWRLDQEPGVEVASPLTRISTGATDPPRVHGGREFLRAVPYSILALGAAFIALTATGKQIARQPSFVPVLMIGCGGWALFSVARGLAKGRIQPIERYAWITYERDTQPKRFWASMAWNSIIACCCLLVAFEASKFPSAQGVQDRCYNRQREYNATEAAQACTDLIEGRARLTYLSRADAFDYRAIADQSLDDRDRALADYGKAIELRPDDYYAFLYRGLLNLDAMRLDQAVADFTRAHEIKPASEWPLADRGMAYAWKNDPTDAEADFAVVRAVNPENNVVRHGEGVLDMSNGDLEGAVAKFTAALQHDPTDLWSLQTRADAYQQMGQFDKAREDRERLEQLRRAR